MESDGLPSAAVAARALFECNEGCRLRRDEEKPDRFIANPDEVVPGNTIKP
jgi:hypothetical protein